MPSPLPACDGYLFTEPDGQPLDEQKALRDELRALCYVVSAYLLVIVGTASDGCM